MFRGMVRHLQTDIVVQPGADRDHARGKSFILVTDWRNGPGEIRGCGDGEAEFVRTAEGWRFASVTLATYPRAAEAPSPAKAG